MDRNFTKVSGYIGGILMHIRGTMVPVPSKGPKSTLPSSTILFWGPQIETCVWNVLGLFIWEKNDPGNTVILYQLSLSQFQDATLNYNSWWLTPPIIFTILVDIPELLSFESLAGKSPQKKKEADGWENHRTFFNGGIVAVAMTIARKGSTSSPPSYHPRPWQRRWQRPAATWDFTSGCPVLQDG